MFVAVVLLFAGKSFAGGSGVDYYDRITISANGEFVYHVNFPFTVPSGNCGNLKVYKYNYSHSLFGQSASWEIVQSGDEVSDGIYKFVNRENECDLTFTIEGSPTNLSQISSWTEHEVEAEDIGLLVRNGWTPDNVFNLSTDDYEYSYEMVFNSFGRKTSIEVLLSGAFNMQGDIIGAIIPDTRGLLSKVIIFNEKMKGKNLLIDENQIIVLIYKEHYNY